MKRALLYPALRAAPALRLVLTLAALATAAWALPTNEVRCPWIGGGATQTSLAHEVRSTLGSTVAGKSTSATYTVLAGGRSCVLQSVTSVPEELPQPEVLQMHPNRPNPFNPQTTIAYDLPVQTRVLLRIYDLGGRQIRTLVDRVEAAGRQSVVWDGKDQHGLPVASGVYFSRLDAASQRFTQKMTLVK